MSFEQALDSGDLNSARALLDELAQQPETGGLYMPECYADLAQSFDHHERYDEAIAAMERAIEHGWDGRPDGRSDIAEFHLRAGRREQAAQIWAQLKRDDPSDVWLYNAAGLSYNEVGEHDLASRRCADRDRRVPRMVRRPRRGSRARARAVRRPPHGGRRDDPVAARTQRALLARLTTKVQEVLRPGSTRGDAQLASRRSYELVVMVQERAASDA